MALLSRAQIKHGLRNSSGWKVNENSIGKQLRFDSFTQATNFVAQIGPVADRLNHHPSITLDYTKVTLTLSSHDEGGVTERDIELALAIEEVIVD